VVQTQHSTTLLNAKAKVSKNKPTPFYLTLIIGKKLLHNSMIDSSASTTVMPKTIADSLEVKYELMEKGVMQSDKKKFKQWELFRSFLSLYMHAQILLFLKK